MNENDPRGVHRKTLVTDPEAAFAAAQRQTDVLANMLGADAKRIDGLVLEVGAVNGKVDSVSNDVRGVAKGVDELRSALAVLVRHEVLMTQQATAVISVVADQKAIDSRLQALERKASGWDESRAWVVRTALGALGVVGLAMVMLVVKPGWLH